MVSHLNLRPARGRAFKYENDGGSICFSQLKIPGDNMQLSPGIKTFIPFGNGKSVKNYLRMPSFAMIAR